MRNREKCWWIVFYSWFNIEQTYCSLAELPQDQPTPPERRGRGGGWGVHMCVHVPGWAGGRVAGTEGRPKSQAEPFPYRSWFSQLPTASSPREGLCLCCVFTLHGALLLLPVFHPFYLFRLGPCLGDEVGGNPEPRVGALVPLLRLPGLGWPSSCCQAFHQCCWVGS